MKAGARHLLSTRRDALCASPFWCRQRRRVGGLLRAARPAASACAEEVGARRSASLRLAIAADLSYERVPARPGTSALEQDARAVLLIAVKMPLRPVVVRHH